ncbi:BLUF domain-containing protein [Stappia sp. ES.058]|uniref:BLUF domain-containing protein n=1 Tax=Stappia sp. ES.058 TaxID=1881061 RepID=UPI00087D5825|nr:BLUF domain-containing protein [Stappia sp. ES.058]SDU04957.1 Sensors of blue-light using FAD [Stappia sp. ES.058]
MTVTRLCYRSTLDFSKMTLPLEEEINRLLAYARAQNSRKGITGALLLAGSTFFQILEGPDVDVRETYARIKDDSRHKNLVMIDERIDSERLMPQQWLFFTDTMDTYDGVLASLFLPIANAPDLVGYDDLVSVMVFSATRVARGFEARDVMRA